PRRADLWPPRFVRDRARRPALTPALGAAPRTTAPPDRGCRTRAATQRASRARADSRATAGAPRRNAPRLPRVERDAARRVHRGTAIRRHEAPTPAPAHRRRALPPIDPTRAAPARACQRLRDRSVAPLQFGGHVRPLHARLAGRRRGRAEAAAAAPFAPALCAQREQAERTRGQQAEGT